MIVGTLFIKQLLEFSLNDKQKFLLLKLVSFEGTASQFVSSLQMPRSTAWHNLRILRKFGIIDFNGPVKIHPAVAQTVEHLVVNREVADSNSARRTKKL